jgi:hypothetical protein
MQADQVLVSGERLHGEAEAINIQRTADNIEQVLPSSVITRSMSDIAEWRDEV